MNQPYLKLAILSCLSAGVLVLASCESSKSAEPAPKPPRSITEVMTQPGVAGGTIEDVYSETVTVSAIDQATRKVTLKGADGSEVVFTAGPEVRNLPQVKAGDKVTATFARRLTVVVRGDGPEPGATYSAAASRALPGEKPGALVAEEVEVVATVKSIDAANRTAVIEFASGATRTLPIRADVDLSRYKAGDKMIIRVTSALTILVATP